MDLLGSRIRDQKAGLTDCKLYVMQCMVPGQRLTVTAPPANPNPNPSPRPNPSPDPNQVTAPPELVELFTVQERTLTLALTLA